MTVEGDGPEIEPFVAYVMDLDVDEGGDTTFDLSQADEILSGNPSPATEVVEQTIAEDGEQESSDSSEEGPPADAGVVRPPDRAINDTVADKGVPGDRLAPFHELNAREGRVSWDERYELIKKQFPSVEHLNWNKVFREDPTIMGNILNDVIKVEVAPPGRPGKRPALDRERAEEVLSKYRKEDYSLLPFAKALNGLKKQLSVRQLARKVSMSPSYCYNLMTGYKTPSVEDMELVAKAFNRHPSHFYEYRVAFVSALMAERMDYAPESSIIYYERAIEAHREAHQ